MDLAASRFEAARPRLTRLAYRMLGSLAEAEDAVQDAFLRWRSADTGAVENPDGFLTTIVGRLCLDRLRAARRRRETYVGEWLPEPWIEPLAPGQGVAEDAVERADSVTYALLLALERLTPSERAAFLLHDVFDLDYAEIARSLERSEAACRQLVSRARSRVKQERSGAAPSTAERTRLVDAFFAAARDGDVDGLSALLAEDAVLRSDGGPARRATLNPIYGREKICRLLAGLARKRSGPPIWSGRALVNGEVGLVSIEADGAPQAVAFEFDAGRIRRVFVMRNPEKLDGVVALAAAD